MNKKILSLVLAILMLFSIVPLAISGATDNAVKIVETGTEYSTFKAAFNAVQNGQTIQFLNNVEESGYLSKSGLKDCTITIDFNGYYYAEKNQRWLSLDSSTTGFTINLKNGTLKAYEANTDSRGFVCLRSGCTYNFTNMVIDCSPAGKNYGGGTVAMAIVADATVNFRNCTITDNGVGTPAGGLVYYNAWTNATVNYYNTNVTSHTALFNNKGTTLYSGTFEAVGSLNIGTYTVASTSTATTAESKKVVVECNHNYTDGYCDYCGADTNGNSPTDVTVTTKATTSASTTAATTAAATTAATTVATTTATTTAAATTAADTSKTFVFLYSNSSSDFTIDTNGHAYNYFNDYNNTGMQISGLVAGQTLTFTSKESLDSGIYSPSLYCRSYSGRAKVNVFINDIQVATGLDTGVSNGTHKPFALDSVTVSKTGPVTIKFVTTSSGSFFPDDIVFEKTGDADPLNVSVSMIKGASIRLSNTNGIRFYTKVDSSKIESLIADGYTVEMGTLITPADLLGDNELTFETSEVKKLNVAYEAKDSSGNFIYYENGDTFVGSIVDIKEGSTSWSTTSGNITRDFVARGYVKVSKDGEE
ncbi:MAG: hypothetical protein ACI39F_02510, partial [Acutalibacteraceae bacterium]